jgi:hypothetical protein
MRKFVLVIKLFLGILAFAIAPSVSAIAHEEHKMECNETAMNAMNADIQAMADGDAKTKAMEEMEMANVMMGKEDTDGCMAHMHKAMEAIEE